MVKKPPALHTLLLIVTITSLVVMFGSIAFLILNLRQDTAFVPDNNSGPTLARTASQSEPNPDLPTDVLIGKGVVNDYKLINPNTGEVIPFMPEGHAIIGSGSYDPFPAYLLTRSNDEVFAYRTEDGNLQPIGLSLQDADRVVIAPSISDSGQFFLTVETREPQRNFLQYTVIASTQYFYNALENDLQEVSSPITLPHNSWFTGCHVYDSVFSRFFTWPCGGSTGAGFPLTVYDIPSNSAFDVVAASEFEVDNRPELLAVFYHDDTFLVVPKVRERFTQIFRIDAKAADLAASIYTVSGSVRSSLPEALEPYGIVWHDATDSFIIGVANGFSILRVDDQNQIETHTFVPETSTYQDQFWAHEAGLFYEAAGSIKTLNLFTLRPHTLDIAADPFTAIGLFKKR